VVHSCNYSFLGGEDRRIRTIVQQQSGQKNQTLSEKQTEKAKALRYVSDGTAIAGSTRP
jgi:hypothetical protein